MNCGKVFYILVEEDPKGIVSVKGNLIENLYVLPTEQRKGYGTRLLPYAETLCEGRPTLWILDNNRIAKNLYQKLGYELTGKEKVLSEILKELEMRKNWKTI